MKTQIGYVIAATALSCALSAPAMATTWDFYALAGSPANPGASLGSDTHTFTMGGQSVVATVVTNSGGVWNANPTLNLYAKGPGPGTGLERGLGIAQDPTTDGEVYYPNGIELVSTAKVSAIDLHSVQGGESYQILGGTCTGTVCSWTDLVHGIGGGPGIDFTGASLANYGHFIVDVVCANNSACFGSRTNAENDIVVTSITTAAVTAVPEPAMLGLLGLGLAGAGFMRKRKIN